MTSSPPLPPPLPVGNQQTGRCEWTVKLYSAACRLPGGRYAIMSWHAPAPVPPPLRLRVSVLVLTLSCCATCGRCGGHWCCEVCFDFKSLPLEDVEGRSLLASAPINLQRARSRPCQAGGGTGEGRDLESCVCTCVQQPVCASWRSPRRWASVESRPVATEHASPSLCPSSLSLGPRRRPHKLPQLRTSP